MSDFAIELLHRACTPMGFVASIQEHDNYKRIWTRDGVVNGLAALMSDDGKLVDTFRATLQTIFDHQHSTGFIPSNVSPEGSVSFGGTVGRADNPCWAVIGLCSYSYAKNDSSITQKYEKHVEKCFALLDAWEFNGKHLVYVPQSGDWADEYIQHGYVLFDQLLRVWALEIAAKVYHRAEWKNKADKIREVIRINFWNNEKVENLYAPNLKHQLTNSPRDFWFLGFNPSRIYNQFDLQANALALLLGIGSEKQTETLIHYLQSLLNYYQTILPSYYPAIETKDWEMKELENNYAYTFRNKAHEFHNGGLWPVWNGFLVAGLLKYNQKRMAEQIANYIRDANRKNNNEFNECLHGQTKEPIGVAFCLWSAGGEVIAEQSLKGMSLFVGE